MNNSVNKSKFLEAPCVKACPVHIDIPRYIRLIADGKFDEALAVIREKIPLPLICGRVCPAPCEVVCNVNRVYPGGSVIIRMLERFVADADRGAWKYSLKKGKTKDIQIAIIGSGPAGLTGAYFLALKGYQVSVFETLPVAGGMLAVAIPEYRLPNEVLNREIQVIRELGVEIKTNVTIGKDLTLSDLKNQGYRAILIAIGAHLSNKLNIEGEKLDGVVYGLDYLRRVNLGEKALLGEKVVVISGDMPIWRSYVAIDSARIALRMGAKKVYILCSHSKQKIPATNKDEIERAEEEGAKIQYAITPVRILGRDGKVVGIECIKTEKVKKTDLKGRKQSTNFTIEANAVIVAVGRSPNIYSLTKECTDWISVTERGLMETDNDGFANRELGIFAAGDVVTAPSSVIKAIAAGRKAAISMDKYLGGNGEIDGRLAPAEGDVLPLPPSLSVNERAVTHSLLPDERLSGFSEVEIGIDEESAVEQAKRCLRCDLPIMADPTRCNGCLTCELRCSMAHGKAFNPLKARIKIRRLIEADNEFSISFTDECDNCGICARYCPYGALIRGRQEMV